MNVCQYVSMSLYCGGRSPDSEGRGWAARGFATRRSTEYLNGFSGGASAGTKGCMQHLLKWPRWSEETAERIEDDIARGGHGDSASAPAQGSAGAGMRRHGHVDVL